MQRIRMSLSYFKNFGWEAEVVKVNEIYSDFSKDELLLKSIPGEVTVHQVNAFSKKWTAKLGLGSIALRSLWFYRKKVNQLLKAHHFDLIYFSTTQFPITILGLYWKKKFNIPYVIDMQDPWHSDYYKNKPKALRPKKYWISYRLNKYLEPIAMKSVDGLIAVSKSYLTTLNSRYPHTKNIPMDVITFGAFDKDFEIAKAQDFKLHFSQNKSLKVVYIGVAGSIMCMGINTLLESYQQMAQEGLQKAIEFYFIGTSYAPKGEGKPSALPIAKKLGLTNVFEQTDRIGFYHVLKHLENADALLIIGSDDPNYTASKIYPYILAKKPLLALFNSASAAATIINNCGAGMVAPLDQPDVAREIVINFLNSLQSNTYINQTNWKEFSKFSAQEMTKKQCVIFDAVLQKNS